MRPSSMQTTITAPDPDVVAGAPAGTERVRFVAAPDVEPAGVPVPSANPGAVRTPRRTPVAVSTATGEARHFAVRTVTALFEVLDRRRPAAHLTTVASPALCEHVATLLRPDLVQRTDHRGVGESTRVRRVHIQMCDSTTAEIFGSYERGRRVRAFAGRIERVPMRVRPSRHTPHSLPARAEYRWRLATFVLN